MTTSTKAVALLVAAAAVATLAQAGRAEMAMGESVDFPHAGIALAMPAGYQSQTVGEPFDIARAIFSDAGQPVQAVTVAAFPLDDPNISAEELADEMVTAQEQNLAIRNLEVLSQAAMTVADVPGAARFIAYDFRGEQTVAASVVCCRDLVSRGARLEYVITVEATADRKAEVLPVLGEVVKSVRLITLVRPIDIPLKPSSQMLESPDGLYALCVPHGWFAQIGEGGISLAQTDYALGGEPTVSACVLLAEVPEGESSERHGQQCIQAATRAAAEQGMETEIIAHGPAPLGAAQAQQLVIEQRLPLAASAPATAGATSEPTSAAVELPSGQPPATGAAAPQAGAVEQAEPNNAVIVQRSVVLPAPQAPQPAHRLSLVLVCLDARPAAAIAIMDKLAEGMVIRGAAAGPATQPSEQVTTTTPSSAPGETE